MAVSGNTEALAQLAQLDSASPPAGRADARGRSGRRAARGAFQSKAGLLSPIPSGGRFELVAILERADAAARAAGSRRGCSALATAPRPASGARFPRIGIGLRAPTAVRIAPTRCRSPSICSAGRTSSATASPWHGRAATRPGVWSPYLLLSRVRNPSREHLAELLFTGADDPLGSLRWNLAELRRGIGRQPRCPTAPQSWRSRRARLWTSTP